MTETTFVTVTELAKRDGVSKPAISKTVKKLVQDHGLEVTRNARGHVAGVAVVQFDHLREKYTSSVKVQASNKEKSKSISPPAADSLDEARRKAAWLDVEKKEFERALALGKYINSEDMEASLAVCGREILKIIMSLPNDIEAIAAGITKEGTHGGREVLKTIRNTMCNKIADRLEAVSEKSPQNDKALVD